MPRKRKRVPRTNQDPNVKCPFFKSWGRTDVRCEGFVPGTIAETRFRKTTDRAIYVQTYCKSRYQDCPVYNANDVAARKTYHKKECLE